MKVVLAGASGFLGGKLIAELTARGHQTSTLVRRAPRTASENEWHPERGELDPAALAGADAVISLSGAGIGDRRWDAEYKRTLLTSRTEPTSTIATALAALPAEARPASWLSASAIGYYGERGDQPLIESATAGSGFLAGLVIKWEAATEVAEQVGVRVVTLRTGLVLSASGGLMKRMVPLFKLGVGGKLGSGKQYQSWISLADEVGAILHLLQSDVVAGPVNLAGPEPVRNDEFTAALASVLHRPALLPVPPIALRLVLGEFADEGVLVSQRVIPEKLVDSGYRFEHPTVHAALEWAVHN